MRLLTIGFVCGIIFGYVTFIYLAPLDCDIPDQKLVAKYKKDGIVYCAYDRAYGINLEIKQGKRKRFQWEN